MNELLPVLVAPPMSQEDREALEFIALGEGVAIVPLTVAPIDTTTHILEVYSPACEGPVFLLARPVGSPTPEGFPLRLRLASAQPTVDLDPVSARSAAWPTLRSLVFTSPTLSERHTADLTKPSPEDDGQLDRQEMIGRSIGNAKFIVQELIGTGSFGNVFRALHRELRRPVAVKVLHPSFQGDLDFCARFYGEALAASRLDHTNIMRVLDFGQEPDGMLYIAMELVDGRTLERVTETGPELLEPDAEAHHILPLARVVDIMMQVCAGLSHAHDHGIIHRDIKPENIMLVRSTDDDGRAVEVVKVCDFGLAQRRPGLAEEAGVPIAEHTSHTAGTPAFMSPEQCRGDELDQRADVYACGVVLFQLVTGTLPFVATNAYALLRKHCNEVPPKPSAFNPRLEPRMERIILRALSKQPADRQQSMRELRTELRDLLTAPSVVAEPPARSRREILDASALTPLDQKTSGFAEFFIAFAGAISRTGYYEPGHPEADVALARLAQAAEVTLRHRGDLAFSRRDVGSSTQLSVLSGVGDIDELPKLLSNALTQNYAEKLADVFVRRSIVALTLEDGIDEQELRSIMELLSGPELGADELRTLFDAARFTRTKILFASDLLGRTRRLSWQVDLCISRLARDLQRLPLLRGASLAQRRALRIALIEDVVRALARPERTYDLLANADLVGSEIAALPEFDGLDVVGAIVSAMPRRSCRLTIEHALTLPASDPIVIDVLRALSKNFLAERSTESDVLLRRLHEHGVLDREELPGDIRASLRAEHDAARLVAAPESEVRSFLLATELPAFASSIAALERAMRILARTAETQALAAIVDALDAVAGDAEPGHSSIEENAAWALRSLQAPPLLAPIADRYLLGSIEAREPARSLLLRTRVAGVHALYAARLRIGVEPAPRARFVSLMRQYGTVASPTLLAAIRSLQPTPSEPTATAFVEDILRSVPDSLDETAGSVIATFVRLGSPPVCKAAIGALVSVWGARAQPQLIGVLENPDDGVRMAAIAGLRKARGIGPNVVARLERLIDRSVPASDELRAAAAGSLADANEDAHTAAHAVLVARLTPTSGGRLSALFRRAVGTPEASMVVVASARALMVLGGAEARAWISERAKKADEPLRLQLAEALHNK